MDGAVKRATGIPYARAGRFRQPQPVPDWQETLTATRPAPACPQPDTPFLNQMLGSTFDNLSFDEDCQNLSITMPADCTADEGLPVMVWVHGGSYVSGAGDLTQFDPVALVSEQRVIVVAVTYRLGLLGFLGDGPDRPANLGLLDQLAAFAWVQRNIAAFGGDPRSVTAFGQSAGADALVQLMATPGADRLFRRVIVQSAPLGIGRGRARMNAAMMEAARDITESTPLAQVTETQALVAQAGGSFGLKSFMPFGPQHEQAPLPGEEAADAARQAVAPKIDLMVGYTAEEARFFVPVIPKLERMSRLPLIGPPLRRGVVALLTHIIYARGARRFVQSHRRAGGRGYLYRLDWSAPDSGHGACHVIDLPLLLGTREAWANAAILGNTPWEEIEEKGQKLRQLWARFSRGETLEEQGTVEGVLRYTTPQA